MKSGDTVALKSGGAIWTIASISGEWATCACESAPEPRTFHVATLARAWYQTFNGRKVWWITDEDGKHTPLTPADPFADALPAPIDTTNMLPTPQPLADQLTSLSPMEKAR